MGSMLQALFPQRIQAVTQEGFVIKVLSFVLTNNLQAPNSGNGLRWRPGLRWDEDIAWGEGEKAEVQALPSECLPDEGPVAQKDKAQEGSQDKGPDLAPDTLNREAADTGTYEEVHGYRGRDLADGQVDRHDHAHPDRVPTQVGHYGDEGGKGKVVYAHRVHEGAKDKP